MNESKTVATPDHDLIVQLNTKFDYMARDIKTLSDGITARIVRLEEHVSQSEKLMDEINPREAIKLVEKHEQYIHDQIHTSKLIKGAINVIWMVLGSLIVFVVEWLRTGH